MLTEEEARKKWCPFTRNGGEPGCNRITSTECIASECMAWRWCDPVCRHKKKGTLHDTSVMNDGFNDASEYELLPQKGYCGLAGSP